MAEAATLMHPSHPSICPSSPICPSIHQSMNHPSVYPVIRMSTHSPIHPPILLLSSVCLPLLPSIRVSSSTHLSVHPSFHSSVIPPSSHPSLSPSLPLPSFIRPCSPSTCSAPVTVLECREAAVNRRQSARSPRWHGKRRMISRETGKMHRWQMKINSGDEKVKKRKVITRHVRRCWPRSPGTVEPASHCSRSPNYVRHTGFVPVSVNLISHYLWLMDS